MHQIEEIETNRMKKYIAAGVLALGTLVVASGCITTADGDLTLESIEEMSELEYSRMSQYVYLGTKIGAARLLESGDLDLLVVGQVADVLEGLVGQPILELTGGFVTDAVTENVVLTSDEMLLILLIVEQEVLARGGATYVDEETGELRLTERTEDLMLLVADALRSAVGGVTLEEEGKHAALEKTRK
jgi:hypothetical protein